MRDALDEQIEAYEALLPSIRKQHGSVWVLIADGQPVVWPEVPNNRAFDWSIGDKEKTDALFAIRLPHGSSDSAWDDPSTVRPYFETSFAHFSRAGRSNHPAHYHADWQLQRVQLSVSGELGDLVEREALQRIRRGRNLVRDMLVTLRAVKPFRDPIQGGTDGGELVLSTETRLIPVFRAS